MNGRPRRPFFGDAGVRRARRSARPSEGQEHEQEEGQEKHAGQDPGDGAAAGGGSRKSEGSRSDGADKEDNSQYQHDLHPRNALEGTVKLKGATMQAGGLSRLTERPETPPQTTMVTRSAARVRPV